MDGVINVLHADEHPIPDFNEMIETTLQVLNKYDIRFDNACRIFVEGANPSFIRALKARVGEDTEYEDQIARWKSYNGAAIVDLAWFTNNIFVLPVQFSKYHKEMLAHCKLVMEYKRCHSNQSVLQQTNHCLEDCCRKWGKGETKKQRHMKIVLMLSDNLWCSGIR